MPASTFVVVGSSSAHLLTAAADQSPGSPLPTTLLIKFMGMGKGATATPNRHAHAGGGKTKPRTRCAPTQAQSELRRAPPLRPLVARPRPCRPHWSPSPAPPPPSQCQCWRRYAWPGMALLFPVTPADRQRQQTLPVTPRAGDDVVVLSPRMPPALTLSPLHCLARSVRDVSREKPTPHAAPNVWHHRRKRLAAAAAASWRWPPSGTTRRRRRPRKSPPTPATLRTSRPFILL